MNREIRKPLRSHGIDYFVAFLAAMTAAALVRLFIPAQVVEDAPMLVFIAAVLVAAWHGGIESGLLATILCSFAGAFFLLPPVNSLWIEASEDQLQLFSFTAIGVLISVLSEERLRAVGRADLRRQELQLVMSSVGDAVIMTDTEGRITLLNPIAESLTGWTFADAEGHPHDEVFKILDEETKQPVNSPVRRTLSTGVPGALSNHTVLVAKEGQQRPIEDSAAPIRDGRGKLTGAILIFRDVTERRRSDQRLQEGEERFRSLVKATAQVVWTTNADGEVVQDSPTWRAFTGQTYDEWKGRGWLNAVHPEDRAKAADAWTVAVNNRAVYQTEYRLQSASGGYRWTAVRGDAVRNADGTIREWVGMNIDISEERRAAARLREQEQQYRDIFESTSDAVLIFDLQGRLAEVNPAACRMHGYSRDELIGKPGLELVAPEDQEKFERFVEVVSSGERFNVEGTHVRKDGKKVFVEVRGTSFHVGGVPHLLAVVRDITERKRAAEALRESEERLRMALESAEIGTWDYNLEHGRLEWSERCKSMFGLPPESEVDYEQFLGRLHPDDRERVNAVVNVALNPLGDGEFDLDYRSLWPDETVRWLVSRGQVFFDGEGANRRPVRFIGTVLDITDRKRAEDELAESQAFLRSSLDALTSHIAVLDASGTILAVNEAWRVFGERNGLTTPFFALGQNYLNACVPTTDPCADSAPDVTGCIRKVIEGTEQVCVLEYPCHSPTQLRWFQMRVTRFIGKGPVRVVVAHEDITHRVLTEQATARRSEQLAKLAEIGSRLNVAQDDEAILNIVAAGARKIIGSHQAVISRTVDQDWSNAVTAISLSEKYSNWRDYEKELYRSGAHKLVCDTNRPIRMTRDQLAAQADSNGDDAPAHSPSLRGWLAAPLISLDGANIGVIQLSDKSEGDFTKDDEAILSQLAQMTSVAIENARLYQEVREADRRKDRFLATLAHELRNPLAPLTASAQLLTLDPTNAAQVTDLSVVMSRQLDQLKWLIDDLLDVSRISSGKLRLRCERVALNDALAAAIDVSRPLVDASRLNLEITSPEKPLFVYGDRVRLSQIIGNLLINAAKYTPEGGRIEVQVSATRGRAHLAVKDNGIGIPAGRLKDIFELFTQVDSSHTRLHGGLGIGLTLVKTLVEMHDGAIQATSEGPNRGSIFTVHLPLLSDEGEPTSYQDSTASNAQLPNLKILVVDDNRSALYLHSRLLQKLDQDVVSASSAQEALDLIADFGPAIVISDIAMPGMSGYDLAKKIRAKEGLPQPMLVALTGYGQESDRQQAFDAGFDDHLVKPVGLEALKSLLTSLGASRT